ncbi:hypothetical protein Pyrfu_1268 [Pyrolobus fumarii 1A]|uniref:Uncharacterized protein n=1 Tax=Pyrolobus fumarii (strain DSM 11204 / 1A) TaxID=694429 RepID=G0EGA2_PYRF1|nr:hypothetical protein Pyrfu_1268 [Pyrolobus fumarii 1A]
MRLAAEVMVATGATGQDAVYIALAVLTRGVLYTLDSGQASAAAKLLGKERVVYVPGEHRTQS